MKKIVFLLVLAAGLFAGETLDTIKVYADSLRYICGAPYGAVVSLSDTEIVRNHPYDLADVMGREGFYVSRMSITGQWTPNIRGVGTGETATALDGIPLAFPQLGAFDLSMMPALLPVRMQIASGAVANIFGSSAMGGAINLISPARADTTPKTLVAAEWGDMNTKRAGVGFSGRYFHKLDASFTGEKTTSNGFNDWEYIRREDFSGMIGYPIGSSGRLSISAIRHRGDIGTIYDGKENDDVLISDLRLTGGSARLGSYLTNIRYQRYDEGFWYDRTTTDPSSNHKNYAVSGDVKYEFPFSGRVVKRPTLWLRGENTKIKSTDTGEHNYNTFAALGTVPVKIARWGALFTLRGERDISGNIVPTEGIFIRYSLTPKTTLKANVGTGYRSPTPNDLWWSRSVFWGSVTQGNDQLKPEHSISAEAGMDFAPFENLTTSSSVYWTNYTDRIEWSSYMEHDTTFWEPMNIGKARFYGIEEHINFALNNLKLKTNYALLMAENTTDSVVVIPYKPKHIFTLGVEFKHKFLDRLIIRTVWNGSYIAGIEPSPYATEKPDDPLALAGGMLSFEYWGLELFGAVDNIGDMHYSLGTGYPLPGRTFRGGLNWRFLD